MLSVGKGSVLVTSGDVIEHRITLPTVSGLVKDVERLQVLELFCVLLFKALVEEIFKTCWDVDAAPTAKNEFIGLYEVRILVW